MNGLDLYAGSGIGALALKYTIPDFRTVCFVENDPYCQAVLVARIKDGLLDDAPIWDDIRSFDGSSWRGKVDFISGGFPCQPFSVAGQRKGKADERNMWPDTLRTISDVAPRYALLENVPGLLAHEYIRQIFGDLAEIGYDCEWDVVSAAFVGAPHLRKRLWILAHPKSVGWRGGDNENGRGGREIQTQGSCATDQSAVLADTESIRAISAQQSRQRNGIEPSSEGMADSQHPRRNATEVSGGLTQRSNGQSQGAETTGKSQGLCNTDAQVADAECLWQPQPQGIEQDKRRRAGNSGWWSKDPAEGSAKSSMGRVAHGLAFRVDRLKMLGNGWVPQVVARILQVEELM